MRSSFVALAALATSACSQFDPMAQLKDEAQEALSHKLKDPYTAVYSDWRLCDKPRGIEGKVNSKNSYGAYSGETDFIYSNGRVALYDESSDFLEMQRACYSDDIIKKADEEANATEAAAADAALDAASNAIDAAGNAVEEASDAVAEVHDSKPSESIDERDACPENATTSEEYEACKNGLPVDE